MEKKDKELKEDDEKDELYPNNSHAAGTMQVPTNQSKPRAKKTNPERENQEIVKTNKDRKLSPALGKGRVIRRKKTFGQFLSKVFVGDDGKNVGAYILYDVLIPAAKNTIQEMVSSGIEMLLFGETKRRNRDRDRDRGRSVIDYRSYYRGDRYDEKDQQRYRPSRDFGLDEILFKHGDDAAEVLEQLCDALEEYRQVTIADFFDLAGIETNYTHQKWGWTNLSAAHCTHVRDGYMIVFPRPIELD